MNRVHLKVTGLPGGPPGISWTACGLIGTPAHVAAVDPRDVDCLNCKRTFEYRDSANAESQQESAIADFIGE